MSELLDRQAGLELTDNDEELYAELLSLYLSDTHFDVKELNEIIMKSKEEAAGYIHKVKGASRQIAAKKLAAKGQEIEDILRGKASGNLAPLINDFCDLYIKTKKEISSVLGQDQN